MSRCPPMDTGIFVTIGAEQGTLKTNAVIERSHMGNSKNGEGVIDAHAFVKRMDHHFGDRAVGVRPEQVAAVG
jgi:hypothetical protein